MMGSMEHSEVRELLEDAAIEPGGLERLMAGDTSTASIVAGHLAGCADCSEELERLRRSVGLIRPTVQLVPPPELKERTLAYVAALGRPRGSTADADPAGAQAGAPIPSIATAAPRPISTRWRPGRPRWLASVAAALIVAVSGTALLVNANHASTTQALSAEVDALGDVARGTLRVDAEPDVRRIELASATGTTGTKATGSLVYSPTSTELVVVAEHLTPAPAGHEYRCWVDVDGHRTGIGKMFFGGDLAYWVGTVKSVAGLPTSARFGVSLVDLASTDEPGDVVLVSD
jgi:anti-sigma-K factor RskA